MKKLNINILAWFLIVFGFFCYFFYLVYTKNYLLFVHPRMYKFIIFGVILFALIAIRQSGNIFRPGKHESFRKGYILFFMVLVLGVFTNTKNISANISSSRAIDIPDAKSAVKANAKANTVSNTQSASQYVIQKPTNLNIIKGNNIEINDADMSYAMDDMYTHPEKYADKSISIKGFIFRDKGFKTNEFVIARLLMTCCTADTSVIGLMADLSSAQNYKTNSWVVVSGVIKLRKAINDKVYGNGTMPYIEVTNVKAVKAPTNQYVY